MLFTLTTKIIIGCVTLAVLVAVTTTVVLLVVNGDDDELMETGSIGGFEDEMPYEVGVGIADMTGPVVEITFMGYAEVNQRGKGLHTRQYSRAFIFIQGDTRVVLVSADVQAVGIAVRREVVKNLQDLYGDIYSLRNVILTGTHTHAAPGGHLVDFLLDISILGFSRETYEAYVEGITRSIVRAHENVVPARLFFSQSTVNNAHMNRSPISYVNNPEEERARYQSDTDTTLTQIRIEKQDGSIHGVMNWFAVHTTSMNMTNHLVSSDNLGYASLLLEKKLNPELMTGKPEIVTAFFSSNLGDVSPNTRGARCEFSGEVCDNHFLLCDFQERCYSLGPGEDMFESTRIIANAVYEGALEALNKPGEELTGHISVVHQFVDIPEETVAKYDPITRTFNASEPVSGCVPAMGYSFASGTIDGANTLNITQGTIVGNPLYDTISGLVVAIPTDEDVECHAPKPILLATGRANFPFPWHPRVASISLMYLGGAVISLVPGEPTTMTGRRIRDVVNNSIGIEREKVIVSGLANEYIHYVATFEEYQIQRYEAASTIYGPHTLNILLSKFNEFAKVALEKGDVPPGPTPIDYRNRTLSLITPVILDASPIGRVFGDVVEEPPSQAKRGDVVKAVFVGANPRNDRKQESTHAAIEKLVGDSWVVVATDADWETKFMWERRSSLLGTSYSTFEWSISSEVELGSYRIRYFGAYRRFLEPNRTNPFEGVSQVFEVIE